MILRFTDSYTNGSTDGIPFDLCVPDYPYTSLYCKQGTIYRIAVSPLEFGDAKQVISSFLREIPGHFVRHGVWKMQILDDDNSILATWFHPLILPFNTKFGYGVEIESLAQSIIVH